jgi:hypothetical protein
MIEINTSSTHNSTIQTCLSNPTEGIMGSFSNGSNIISEVSPEQVIELIKEEGFTAEILKGSTGQPRVSFKVEGFNSSIWFYSERDNKQGYYKSLQFAAGFKDKISIEKANKWNQERRFIKVYSDSDGELAFEMDVSLEGGVTRQYVIERITEWRGMFSLVLAYVLAD